MAEAGDLDRFQVARELLVMSVRALRSNGLAHTASVIEDFLGRHPVAVQVVPPTNSEPQATLGSEGKSVSPGALGPSEGQLEILRVTCSVCLTEAEGELFRVGMGPLGEAQWYRLPVGWCELLQQRAQSVVRPYVRCSSCATWWRAIYPEGWTEALVVGGHIRARRLIAKRGLRELAAELGISAVQLGEIERGKFDWLGAPETVTVPLVAALVRALPHFNESLIPGRRT